mgnify:CR=1 FL=1
MSAETIHTFEFGVVQLFENYLIVTMNRGITVIPEYNDILLELANTHYKDKPFVYITHRKNSYAVDPAVYKRTSKIENLVGFAVVSKKEIDSKTVPVEKLFFTKPFQLFEDKDEAIAWAEMLTKEANK